MASPCPWALALWNAPLKMWPKLYSGSYRCAAKSVPVLFEAVAVSRRCAPKEIQQVLLEWRLCLRVYRSLVVLDQLRTVCRLMHWHDSWCFSTATIPSVTCFVSCHVTRLSLYECNRRCPNTWCAIGCREVCWTNTS